MQVPANGATIYYATTDSCIFAQAYSLSYISPFLYMSYEFSVTAFADGTSFTYSTSIGLIPTRTVITVTFPSATVSTLVGPVTFVKKICPLVTLTA